MATPAVLTDEDIDKFDRKSSILSDEDIDRLSPSTLTDEGIDRLSKSSLRFDKKAPIDIGTLGLSLPFTRPRETVEILKMGFEPSRIVHEKIKEAYLQRPTFPTITPPIPTEPFKSFRKSERELQAGILGSIASAPVDPLFLAGLPFGIKLPTKPISAIQRGVRPAIKEVSTKSQDIIKQILARRTERFKPIEEILAGPTKPKVKLFTVERGVVTPIEITGIERPSLLEIAQKTILPPKGRTIVGGIPETLETVPTARKIIGIPTAEELALIKQSSITGEAISGEELRLVRAGVLLKEPEIVKPFIRIKGKVTTVLQPQEEFRRQVYRQHLRELKLEQRKNIQNAREIRLQREKPEKDQFNYLISGIRNIYEPISEVGSSKSSLTGAVAKTFVRSTEAVINRTESGRLLTTKLNTVENEAMIDAGTFIDDMLENLRDFNFDELQLIRKVLDGKKDMRTVSPKIIQAFRSERTRTDTIADLAVKNNLQTYSRRTGTSRLFQPREDFFPRYVKIEMLEKKDTLEQAIEHLVKTGQSPNRAEAIRLLDILRKRLRLPRFGHLEFSRDLDLPETFYQTDIKEILSNYYYSSFKRLRAVQEFGRNGEKANELVNAIRLEGGDSGFAKTVVERSFGLERQSEAKKIINSWGSSYEALTKLGLTQFNQLGQLIVNNIVRNGLINQFRALFDYSKSAKTAIRSGSILQQTIKQAQEQMYGRGIASNWLKMILFTKFDISARIVGAGAGRLHAISMAERLLKNPLNKFARRRLKQLNLNPDEILSRGGLTEREELIAAQRASFDANFRGSILDIPEAFTNENWRLITLYKSFGFQQTKLISEYVVKEAFSHGNLLPLTQLLTVGGIMGEVISDIKSAIRHRVRPEGIKRLFENYSQIAAFGLIGDMLQSARFGTEGAQGALLGPAGSDIAKLFAGIGELTKGKSKPITKFGLQQIPIFGSTISNIFFPPKKK